MKEDKYKDFEELNKKITFMDIEVGDYITFIINHNDISDVDKYKALTERSLILDFKYK